MPSRSSRSAIPEQMALVGVDPYAHELRILAQLRVADTCPELHGRPGDRCFWVRCPNHCRHWIGNESAQLTPEEIAQDIATAEATCVVHSIRLHPDGQTQDEVAAFYGVSRQTLQPLWAAAEASFRQAILSLLDEEEDNG